MPSELSWVVWLLAGIFLVFGLVVFRGAPYVPSRRRQVERAFDTLRPIGKGDMVVDVGSGDGRVLRLASNRGARAVGYELNPILVAISWLLSRTDSRVKVRLGDFWLAVLPRETTVVYGFMVERDIMKIAAKLQKEANRLGHPLDFISYGFAIPERERLKGEGAHHLYRFEPLQGDEA